MKIVLAILLAFATPVLADEMDDLRMRRHQADIEYRMRAQEAENNRRFESLQRQQRETEERLDAQRRQSEIDRTLRQRPTNRSY